MDGRQASPDDRLIVQVSDAFHRPARSTPAQA